MTIKSIDITKILPNPYQPKSRLEPSADILARMVESIKVHGIMQTPVVRDFEDLPGRYQMADGWLRFQAVALIHEELEADCENAAEDFSTIECDVRELTDRQMADMVLEANTVRQDLTIIDKAYFYKKYIEDFQVTQAELARLQNCSQGEIANTIRLLKLPVTTQQLIISRDINETAARMLLQLTDDLQIGLLAQEIISKGMTVAALDARIRELLQKEPKQTKTEPISSAPQVIEEPKHAPTDNTISQKETEPVKSPEPSKAVEPQLNKPAPQPSTPANSAPQPAPVSSPVKPIWKRKLVLEEKDGCVMASVMREGAFPVMRRLEGTLEQIMDAPADSGCLDAPLIEFLIDANEKWQEETK